MKKKHPVEKRNSLWDVFFAKKSILGLYFKKNSHIKSEG